MKDTVKYDRIFTCNTKYCTGDVQLMISSFVNNDRICPVIVAAPTVANTDQGWVPDEILLRLAVNTDIDPQNDKCFWLKSYAENEGVDDFLFGYNIARPTGRTQEIGHNVQILECMLMPEEEWFTTHTRKHLGTVPTQESIVQELTDLIDELEAVRDTLEQMDLDENDLSGLADDLSCQSGTIGTILQHLDQLSGN